MKADYERQIASLSDILARLTSERAELTNGVDNEHPSLMAFMKHSTGKFLLNLRTTSRFTKTAISA